MSAKRILITNDDGISSKGLRCAAEAAPILAELRSRLANDDIRRLLCDNPRRLLEK